jgi:tRNA pseudouridine55 synthase
VSTRKASRRALDGVLLLDKPLGITSQTAVTRAKMLYSAQKAGHTGTLDPMASGLLPIAFGEATKFTHALLEADKTYAATVRLGVTTTTGDLEGEVVAEKAANVTCGQVEEALTRFRGEIVQTPPMYSALKVAGRPLYEYARAGTEIERDARRITIRALELDSIDGPELRIRVACSKGTYVRVLAEDIGRALGCGATLAALRRTAVGVFSVERAVTFETLQGDESPARDARLLPVDALVSALPSVVLDAGEAQKMVHGQNVGTTDGRAGLVRVYGADSRFIGVADAAGGVLAPRRLMASNGPKA